MRIQICLFGLLMTIGTAAALGVKKAPGYVVEDPAPLVSHALLKEVDLEYRWQVNLPVKENENIQTLGVFGPYLFVLTDSNMMFCVDRSKGRLMYTEHLSTRKLPVYKPLYFKEDFWFVVGSEVLVFDPSAGYITERQSLTQIGNLTEYGFARNSTHLYLAGSDNRLHVINTHGYWEQFTATADNDSEIVTVVARDDVVVFGTKAGNVVAMNPMRAQKYWQFDLTGGITTPLVMDGKAVYVGGLDSKLYKLENGILARDWKTPFHSGSPIHDPFVVGQSVIYLKNSLNGLYGVSKDTGEAIWQVPTGQGMICETDNRSYVFVSPGILKCMDNKTGKEVYTLNFSQVKKYASNTDDPLMYLTDLKGRLMCLSAAAGK